jgi:cytochrome bd ubiquinol oxidase subunit I
MSPLILARWQFGVTTVYHFFFVPLTLGLSILVAVMETLYVRTGNDLYKRMAKFWGKLFLINFAMGVVTGIVQEFQFGLNWSEYSRFVGDIFGAPLAIEALLAFFLESTFLGLWIFGWDKLSKGLHAATIWLVAFGSNLSALWILVANSFMQEPVGFTLRNGRAEMTDFFALIKNPHVWVQFPHTVLAGFTTAAFFVLGISAYHLWKKKPERELFFRSFVIAAVFGAVSSLAVAGIGHQQGQHMVKEQPMKMAAAEALWHSEDPAALSLFSVIDEEQQNNSIALRVPYALSFLSFNQLSGEVKGLIDLQNEYAAKYGPGNYIPPVGIVFWSFRIMVGCGTLLIFLALLSLFLLWRRKLEAFPLLLRLLPWAIGLPYLANSTGWLLTEMGRQPWVVFGLMKTEQALSPNVSAGSIAFSLAAFTLLYAALMAADVYLLVKFARNEQPQAAGKGELPAIEVI